MPNFDEPTNPGINMGAIPQRANTGTYSVPYVIAPPGYLPANYGPPQAPPPQGPPAPGYLPYNAPDNNAKLLKLWQVILGFVLAGITIVGAGFTFASQFFVTQDAQTKVNTSQAITNASLQNAVMENTRTTERLERAIDKLTERIENLNNNGRKR